MTSLTLLRSSFSGVLVGRGLRDGVDLGVDAEVAVDRRRELGRARDDRLHLASGDGPDVVEREHVRRVGHRDDELPVLPADRDGLVAAGDGLAHEAHGRRVDRGVGEVEVLEPDLLGEGADEVGLGDRAELDEDPAELLARPHLVVQGRVELGLGQEALAHQ